MENHRKCTPWKITVKSQPENDRMENAEPENGRKKHQENDRKVKTGK